MSSYAEIRVSTGPDRGKSFEMKDDMVHIGHAADNECVLEDDTVGDHQVSIVQRSGRYAICSPHDGVVDVDGTLLPADQWVWLPATAKIKVSQRTSLVFEAPKSNGSPEGQDSAAASKASSNVEAATEDRPPAGKTGTEVDSATQSAIRRSRKRKSEGGKKGKRSAGQSTIARFIRDKSGDALVRLGEDGKLPELALSEQDRVQEKTQTKKKSNPATLYAVLGFSFFMSLGMLFFDAEGTGAGSSQKAKARAELKQYLGDDEGELKLYQRELRAARLAHARGDYSEEKLHYRRVIRLLNSEDLNSMVGVTGRGPAADRELRKLLATLLSSK